jgi:YVTN family beta-propeller protein
MPLVILAVATLLACATAAMAQAPASTAKPTLDFDFYRARIEPMFLVKRPRNVRCVECHTPGQGALRLQALPEGTSSWTEEASRQNFKGVTALVVTGNPKASRLLQHPLERESGGDAFHGGGKHWSANDAEYKTLAAWVRGETLPPTRTVPRIIQTNAAGDDTHVIDPATNKVVGVINDIRIPHGITGTPDGSRVYISNESLHTLDAVDALSLSVIARVPLSGRPNNVSVSKDGRKVYVGIAQNPGALDVIDTATLKNVKTVPVAGAVHNVYVTPDGKFAVAGSVGSSTISIVDTTNDEMVRTIKLSAGIRPMTFDTNPDGSTKRIFVQLSGFHGFVAVDFNTGQEVARIEHPAIPGAHAHNDGLQGAPAHGLGVTPDGKQLWSTSKVYGYAYVHSLPDLKEIARVEVGQHPEWLTFAPDGKRVYIAAAGDNQTSVVDTTTFKVVTRIPVGEVPKRNGTAMLRSF